MGESQAHHDLVQRTYRYIRERFPPDRGFAIFLDAPGTLRRDKPGRLHGFVPDVLAVDVPTTVHVVGEAKTAEDLGRPHTTAQLRAYLRHLRILGGGILVISVPWAALRMARRIVAAAVVSTGATNVEIVVLDDTEPCL
jgi:hypothetical protein